VRLFFDPVFDIVTHSWHNSGELKGDAGMQKQLISKAIWNRVKAEHGPGTKVSAVVRRHVGFGAICDVGSGRIPAKIRNLEIDWDPAKQHSRTIPEGTSFEAVVLGFEDEWRELLISRKAAQPSPFENYIGAHPIGSIVEGEVHEITPSLVIVRLSGGLEGVISHDLIPRVVPPKDEPDLNWRLTKGDHIKSLIVNYDRSKCVVRLDLAAAVKLLLEQHKRLIQSWKLGEITSDEPISHLPNRRRLEKLVTTRCLTILVVDDERDICAPIVAALRDRGHRVQSASLCSEAYRIIEHQDVLDVVMVDQQLPDGSGLDLVRKIRSKFSSARSILFTGNPGAVSARDLNDVLVLVKPLETEQIIGCVEGYESICVTNRVLKGDESLGELSQMTASEVDQMHSRVRQALDAYLTALQECISKSKVAVLRLQESTNRVACLRSVGMSPATFDRYCDSLRFSFIGRVLEGGDSGFHRLGRNLSIPESREPLSTLMRELGADSVYGLKLEIESQPDQVAVFAFFNSLQVITPEQLRDFSQTARALSLAVERATLDAQLFKHQRVMVAGSVLLGMGHELRNQVQSLTSLTDQMEGYEFNNNLSAFRKEWQELQTDIHLVRSHAVQVRDILESVLSLTRSRVYQQVTLGQVLDTVVKQCERAAKTDEIFLQMEVPTGLRSVEVCNAIQHVLLNLILNSLQHVRLIREHGTGYVIVRASRDDADNTSELVISVEDNAFGIDWSNRFRIFSPFVTTRSHGTGLGLSVARMIAESEEGALDVESSFKFLGTTFVLRLPIDKGAP